MASKLKELNNDIKSLMRAVKIRNAKMNKKGLDGAVEIPDVREARTVKEAKEIIFKAESYLRHTSSKTGIRKVAARAKERRERQKVVKTLKNEINNKLKKVNSKIREMDKRGLDKTSEYERLTNSLLEYGLDGKKMLASNRDLSEVELKNLNKTIDVISSDKDIDKIEEDHKRLMSQNRDTIMKYSGGGYNLEDLTDEVVDRIMHKAFASDKQFNAKLYSKFGLPVFIESEMKGISLKEAVKIVEGKRNRGLALKRKHGSLRDREGGIR